MLHMLYSLLSCNRLHFLLFYASMTMTTATIASWLDDKSSVIALVGLQIFLLVISGIATHNSSTLFCSWHGWSHRLAGGLHLLCLLVGAYTCTCTATSHQSPSFYLVYDMTLGGLGILATLTAARDFPHKLVANATGQSGTLHKKAIVTQSEMLEHAFYQGLNLCQALYLHAQYQCRNAKHDKGKMVVCRMSLLFLVTAPWLVRHWLPVSSFSHNWNKRYQNKNNDRQNLSEQEILLYRIKKAQCLFYKHVILHGVNISVATTFGDSTATNSIPHSTSWRVFWILLNGSYVMEFFLQTMVKRRIIQQDTMLGLQRWLMAAASTGAVVVLQQVSVGVCVISLVLNFTNRRHDVLNTMMIANGVLLWNEQSASGMTISVLQ
jgi:hypothetical protein